MTLHDHKAVLDLMAPHPQPALLLLTKAPWLSHEELYEALVSLESKGLVKVEIDGSNGQRRAGWVLA